jgi:GMP synthase (glutamine-hydrolysing)
VTAHLLVIQHEDDCPPGWFGEWLDAAGLSLHVVRGHRGDPVPGDASGYDGLLVLGGEMGAYDDVACPWLAATKGLIARTVDDGVPFLGICLGHQLATVALGGSVIRNPAGTSAGLTVVRPNGEGIVDDLLSSVRSGSRAVQWNEDVAAVLPPGSTPLAWSPDSSVQAARFGSRAWGVQFHPEVSPEIFASWTVAGPKADEPRPDGVDIARAAADIEAAGSELRAAWWPMAERFAEIVISATPSAGSTSVATSATVSAAPTTPAGAAAPGASTAASGEAASGTRQPDGPTSAAAL